METTFNRPKGTVRSPPPSRYRFPPDSPKINLKAFGAIVLSLALYLGLNIIVNRSDDANRSFILAVVAGAVALVPLLYSEVARQEGTIRFGLILGTVYCLKTGLGVGHFLVFIQPDYFAGNPDFTYHWDYMWLDQSMRFVADTWNEGGLFSPIADEYWLQTKSAILLVFMSLNYFATGSFPLNFVPWNTLFGIYSAILILEIGKSTRLPASFMPLVMWIALLLPFNAITSLLWRDTTGQFLVFLGVYLLVQTRLRLRWWLFVLPVAGFLAWLQREPYLFVIFLGGTLWLLNELRRSRYALILVGMSLLMVLLWVPLAQRISSFALVRYTNPEDGIGAASVVARGFGLPVRVLRGIVGPFPWTQYIQKVAGYEFQPADYLQHVLNLAVLWCALPFAWRNYKMERKIELSFILALGLIAMGVLATGVHSSYISIGIPLLLPLSARVGPHEFLKRLGIALIIFVIANFVYVLLGLQGSNFFQEISGGY